MITNKCLVCECIFAPELLKKYGRTCSRTCFEKKLDQDTKVYTNGIKLNEIESEVREYLKQYYKPYF